MGPCILGLDLFTFLIISIVLSETEGQDLNAVIILLSCVTLRKLLNGYRWDIAKEHLTHPKLKLNIYFIVI